MKKLKLFYGLGEDWVGQGSWGGLGEDWGS